MKWYWSKYPTWVKNLVVILAIILGGLWSFYEIWKSGEKAVKKGFISDTSRKAPAQTTSEVLKIKGFYLGMNIDEAANLLNQNYASIMKRQTSVKQLENGTFRIAIVTDVIEFGPGSSVKEEEVKSGEITAGSDKRVNTIIFNSDIVDILFNSKDMDVDEFVKEFAKAYGISNFEPFIKKEKAYQVGPYTNTIEEVPKYKNGYKCSSDNGYYIEISEEKNLLIKSIPKQTERSFD